MTLRWIALLWVVMVLVSFSSVGWAIPTGPVPPFPEVKLMVIVPEAVQGHATEVSASETEMISMFMEAGYKVVDPKQYASTRGELEKRVLEDPTSTDARAAIAQFAADILIVGKANAELAGTAGGGMASYRAAINARSFVTRGDGTMISICNETGAGADIAPATAATIALRNAGYAGGQKLMGPIGKLTGGPQTPAAEPPLSRPEGKPVLGVLRFKDETQYVQAGWQLGLQVPHQISNALFSSERFDIAELMNIEDIKDLQAVMQSGTYNIRGREAEAGTLAPIQFAVIGRITGLSVQERCISLFGKKIGVQEAKATVYVAVVDVRAGVVKASAEGEGDATSKVMIDLGSRKLALGDQQDDSAPARAMRKAVNDAAMKVAAAFPAYCSHCGAQVKATAKFCGVCGGIVCPPAAMKCANCGKPMKPGQAFCEECGAALTVAAR